MAIYVEWDNEEKTVLRMAYGKNWNWRDHQIALDVVSTLLGTVSHPVDLIVDLNGGTTLPKDTAPEQIIKQSLPPNWSGRAVVLTSDTILAQAILDALPQANLTPTPY